MENISAEMDNMYEFVGQIIDTIEDYFALHDIPLAGKNPQEEALFDGTYYDAIAIPVMIAYRQHRDILNLYTATLCGLKNAIEIDGNVVLDSNDCIDLNYKIIYTIKDLLEHNNK